MERLKEILRMAAYGHLIVEGKDGTFARCPLWLAILFAIVGRRALRFAVLTALMIAAFGMRVRLEDGRA